MSSVPAVPKPSGPVSPEVVEAHLCALLRSMVAHDGYADLRVESRILKRGQKEVILHCGKQYRYVVDYRPTAGTPPEQPSRNDPAPGAPRD